MFNILLNETVRVSYLAISWLQPFIALVIRDLSNRFGIPFSGFTKEEK